MDEKNKSEAANCTTKAGKSKERKSNDKENQSEKLTIKDKSNERIPSNAKENHG